MRDFSPQVSAGWDDNGDVFFDFDNKLLESITAERRSSEYCLEKDKKLSIIIFYRCWSNLVQNNPNGPQVCLSVILVRQKYLWSHVKRWPWTRNIEPSELHWRNGHLLAPGLYCLFLNAGRNQSRPLSRSEDCFPWLGGCLVSNPCGKCCVPFNKSDKVALISPLILPQKPEGWG